MRNFKVILQYEGTRYQGWQKQESTENTIQGKLEMLLTKMSGTRVEVQGSGRTDAGVHAVGQVANFHLDTDKSPISIMEYMNFYLPEDIAVTAIEEVPDRFHSRLNAKGKTYMYRVINSAVPHVLDRKFACVIEEKLDVEAMRRTAAFMVGTHDFKAFTSLKKSKKSTVRTVTDILIEETGNPVYGREGIKDELIFTFRGNGFLYHMVRIMMGTLIDVGMHKKKPEEIADILATGTREDAGELVPAKGLTLMEVRY